MKKIFLYVVLIPLISGCVASSGTLRPTPAPKKIVEVTNEGVVSESSPIAETLSDERVDIAQLFAESGAVEQTKMTYSQITYLISEFIDIEPVEEAFGQEKFSGSSENKLIRFEIIGEKDDVKEASIKLFYSEDIEPIDADLNNAVMLRFFKNAMPGFEKGWMDKVKDMLARFDSIENGSTAKEEIPFVRKSMRIVYDKKVDSIAVTVKRK